jgi:hypothetical protein
MHPQACLTSLILLLRCRQCGGHEPLPKLIGYGASRLRAVCSCRGVAEIDKDVQVRRSTELNAYFAAHGPIVDAAVVFNLPEPTKRGVMECKHYGSMLFTVWPAPGCCERGNPVD